MTSQGQSLPIYTPLESLLLFQALRNEGVAPTTFHTVSDQLQSVRQIRLDPSYDAGRLSADALRDLYLRLLKEEIRHELDQKKEQDNVILNGDVSPASRKRKAPSPNIPTVHEAAQHSHLIPHLVSRLYARYRETTVSVLREYERKHSVVLRQVGDIQNGERNGEAQRQPPVQTVHSPKPSVAAHTQTLPYQRAHGEPLVDASPHISPAGTPVAPPKRYSQAKIDAVINHGPEPPTNNGGHSRASSTTTLPPLSEMAPQSPRFGIPPKLGGANLAQLPNVGQPPGSNFNHSPTRAHQSPYPPHHAHPVSNNIAGPHLQNQLNRPSSSPRPILPPPPGMQLPPPSPVQLSNSQNIRGPPVSAQQSHYQPHHRPHAGHSPANDRAPRGYQQPLPPGSSYYQPHQQTYQERRGSYQPRPVHPSTPYAAQPPHYGGFQLPPFAVEPSNPQQHQQVAPEKANQRYNKTYSQVPKPVASQKYPGFAPVTRPTQGFAGHSIRDIIAALATPPRTTRPLVWKSERRAQRATISHLPSRPAIEPLSPVKRPANPPTIPTRRLRPPSPEPAEKSLLVDKTAQAEQGRRASSGQNNASATSSTATRGESAQIRSRSPSASIPPNAVSESHPRSKTKVKPEPSTPASVAPDAESAAEPSAISNSGPMTRKRRGTLQPQTLTNPKRMRQQSPAPDTPEGDTLASPPPQSKTILATRNFARMSATIMNDINSHKHASYFAGPVRDRDASGYGEIIKQPQHLKAIRAAISAGTRAIASAVSSLESPAETPTTSSGRAADSATTIELERTADAMPPKAIVNGAQLEKEVMRMFANAVMFNPGEDGLVADTREMFEDIEPKLREWRGAEREADGDEEEDGAGKGKRRKL